MAENNNVTGRWERLYKIWVIRMFPLEEGKREKIFK